MIAHGMATPAPMAAAFLEDAEVTEGSGAADVWEAVEVVAMSEPDVVMEVEIEEVDVEDIDEVDVDEVDVDEVDDVNDVDDEV